MNTIRGMTADDVWRQAYEGVTDAGAEGVRQKSRIGDTSELLHVAIEITQPQQRLVTSRRPAINPAFAIAEAIWILGGSEDAAVLNFWNRQLPTWAGRTATYHGAYGHRLRRRFGMDQLRRACEALRANPASRQVVLQLWDVTADLPAVDGSPRAGDIPCNICSMLKVRDGRLEWTQVVRSNDLFRGLPYNIFQFTVLQEVLAGWLELEMGSYHQWSDSLHLYERDTGSCSVAATVPLTQNADSLWIPYHSEDIVIGEFYARLETLARSELSESHLTAAAAIDIPCGAGFQNWFWILGAESARRRSELQLAARLAARCSSAYLTQAWEAWWQRVVETGAAV